MSVRKCSLTLTNCEDFDTISLTNICKYIIENNAIWSAVFSSIKPAFTCPIKKVCATQNIATNQLKLQYRAILQGDYHVENGLFDLGIISRIPMEPERLNVNLTLGGYAIGDESKLKKPLICLDVKVTITQSKTWLPKRNRTTTI